MSFDLWTIGLEVVNFLVLVWLLERLLYRPVLGIIGRRQAEIERLQAADESAQRALAAEREQLERERQSVAAERARALDEAHTQAREERARLEGEARAEMDRLLAAGRARLEHERADVARSLRRKSVEVGVAIARRLVSLSAPPGGDGRFVETVCEQLRSMEAGDRARIVAGLGERSVVRVVTAEEMDSRRQDECRERIAQALGRAVDTFFSVDSALIAGIEVHFPGLVLRHCWRDALAAAETSLVEEAEHGSLEGGEHGRNAR
jgi:F-type H+-transporting ATPase subunit b